jgi:phosphoglycolate phosphatase-like HAD superfamily hydrolase
MLFCLNSSVLGDSSKDAQAANAVGCPVVLMPGCNPGERIRNTPARAY